MSGTYKVDETSSARLPMTKSTARNQSVFGDAENYQVMNQPQEWLHGITLTAITSPTATILESSQK